MPSTHSNILLHVIYSTKNRFKLIDDNWRDELFAYIGVTAKDQQGSLLEAGGIEDHIHLLIRSYPSFAIADTVRLIKSNSWCHWGQTRFSVFLSVHPEAIRIASANNGISRWTAVLN